ncbi:hypothetical protein PaecuDRAFT_0211 [Paenibacillus curdlanolyticus YK9]|uniref:Uncharacterized protein n=1 Tax=Paenibacillus curdlanolyticus YK9 TaxID=717606 RepID=E0I336_9BACL|nr:hypothetical protein PaecuDRAFT_0211 [Paenibacillus curdlanolyticus YK9]
MESSNFFWHIIFCTLHPIFSKIEEDYRKFYKILIIPGGTHSWKLVRQTYNYAQQFVLI